MENIEINSNGNDTLNGTTLDKFNEIFDNLVKSLSLPRIHEYKRNVGEFLITFIEIAKRHHHMIDQK